MLQTRYGIAFAVAVLLKGCGTGVDCGTCPPVLTGLRMTVEQPTPAQAVAGSLVSVAVRVVQDFSDGSTAPAGGVSVTFRVAGGGGTVAGAAATTVTTNAQGVATVSWSLGYGDGPQQLVAERVPGVSLTFDVQTSPAPTTTRITAEQPAPSQAVAGSFVSVAVRVSKVFSNDSTAPAAGVPVTFRVTGGGGTVVGVSATTVTTDAQGVATATWTLGYDDGAQQLVAEQGPGASVTFDILTTPAPATAMAIAAPPLPNAAAGQALATAPTIQLKHAAGGNTRQAGLLVTVSVEPATAALQGTLTVLTDNTGLATFTGLSVGGAVGQYRLVFTATIGGQLVTVRSGFLTLGAGPAETIEAVPTQAPYTATITHSVLPSVRLRDHWQNLVPGAPVSFLVTQGGGSVTIPAAVTTAEGTATPGKWLMGPAPGINRLTATSVVLPGQQVQFISTATGFEKVIQMAAGDWHTCALVATGAAFCWGLNARGQLGDRSTADRLSPVPVAGDLSFSQIGVGEHHTCAVVSGGDTFCWGENGGNLGDGTEVDRHEPSLVLGNKRFVQIAIAGYHNCGLDNQGQVFCWGLLLGGLGGPTLWPSPVEFVSIERDANHTCGLTAAGNGYCWGMNDFFGSGQLGDGTIVSKTTPTAVVGNHRFRAFGLGFTHTCAIDLAAAAWCWGFNHGGQLGDGTTTTRITPVQVLGGLKFSKVDGGNNFVCGLDLAGLAYCWGWGNVGQIGDGLTTFNQLTPKAVAGAIPFVGLSTTGLSTCAWTATGRAYCWGYNLTGQIGDGTKTDRLMAVRIDGGT